MKTKKVFIVLWSPYHRSICLLILLAFLRAHESYGQQQPLFHPPLLHLKVTSSFGQRMHPVSHKMKFHNGVDLAARASPVYSILSGTVIQIGHHPYLGNFITLSCSSILVTYGHLSRILVPKGARLYPGQCIAISGKTGRVTGEHLHLAIKFQGKYISPIAFMTALASNKRRLRVSQKLFTIKTLLMRTIHNNPYAQLVLTTAILIATLSTLAAVHYQSRVQGARTLMEAAHYV